MKNKLLFFTIVLSMISANAIVIDAPSYADGEFVLTITTEKRYDDVVGVAFISEFSGVEVVDFLSQYLSCFGQLGVYEWNISKNNLTFVGGCYEFDADIPPRELAKIRFRIFDDAEIKIKNLTLIHVNETKMLEDPYSITLDDVRLTTLGNFDINISIIRYKEADINGDGKVDYDDLLALAVAYGSHIRDTNLQRQLLMANI